MKTQQQGKDDYNVVVSVYCPFLGPDSKTIRIKTNERREELDLGELRRICLDAWVVADSDIASEDEFSLFMYQADLGDHNDKDNIEDDDNDNDGETERRRDFSDQLNWIPLLDDADIRMIKDGCKLILSHQPLRMHLNEPASPVSMASGSTIQLNAGRSSEAALPEAANNQPDIDHARKGSAQLSHSMVSSVEQQPKGNKRLKQIANSLLDGRKGSGNEGGAGITGIVAANLQLQAELIEGNPQLMACSPDDGATSDSISNSVFSPISNIMNNNAIFHDLAASSSSPNKANLLSKLTENNSNVNNASEILAQVLKRNEKKLKIIQGHRQQTMGGISGNPDSAAKYYYQDVMAGEQQSLVNPLLIKEDPNFLADLKMTEIPTDNPFASILKDLYNVNTNEQIITTSSNNNYQYHNDTLNNTENGVQLDSFIEPRTSSSSYELKYNIKDYNVQEVEDEDDESIDFKLVDRLGPPLNFRANNPHITFGEAVKWYRQVRSGALLASLKNSVNSDASSSSVMVSLSFKRNGTVIWTCKGNAVTGEYVDEDCSLSKKQILESNSTTTTTTIYQLGLQDGEQIMVDIRQHGRFERESNSGNGIENLQNITTSLKLEEG